MSEEYICKRASLCEMERKWNSEIERNKEDRENWIVWKQRNLERFKKGQIIVWYGILDGIIICEATAAVHPDAVQNACQLVDQKTAYLSAFRTLPEYQNRGHFSKLFSFMIDDLQNSGFQNASIGVEADDLNNKEIYSHFGFTEFIKSAEEIWPDGTRIQVDYYRKNLSADEKTSIQTEA